MTREETIERLVVKLGPDTTPELAEYALGLLEESGFNYETGSLRSLDPVVWGQVLEAVAAKRAEVQP